MRVWALHQVAVLGLSFLCGFAVAESLPGEILRLPETVPVAFVADVSDASFHRYERDGERVVLTGSYYMSIGKAGFGKQRVGDQRTPIGAYFVTEQLDTSRLHEKYGVTAFPLDYPNVWDQRKERTGSGIWVHGVDPNGGQRPVFDTDGCIALPNAELTELTGLFRPNETPVIVTNGLAATASNEALVTELSHSVAAWARSKADGDLYGYLSLYHPSFSRWSMSREEWSSLMLQNLPTRGLTGVEVSELLLLRYPGEKDLFLSRFRERVVAGESVSNATRRLFWRRDSSGRLTIIAEDMG